jgi:hypothetical protein
MLEQAVLTDTLYFKLLNIQQLDLWYLHLLRLALIKPGMV